MSTGINVSKPIKVLDEGTQIAPDINQIDFTGTGVTATASGNNITVNVAGASGVFGIANTSGVYTFYSTLTLAMAAATSGQTIEMFADVTETGAVTVTLKDGVTINGNGHTYKHTSADSTNTFNTIGTGGNFNIFNLNITRINSTGGYVLVSGGGIYGPLENFYLDGSVITCNNSAVYTTAIYTTKKFYNANIILTGSGYGIIPQQIGEIYIYNFNVKSLSSSTAICCYGALAYNSIFENEGSSTLMVSQSKVYNCSVISRGSAYCISGGCSAYNSFFYSAAGFCTYVNNIEFNGCTFVSAGSYAVYTETPIPFRNCTVISTANIAAVNGIYTNASIYSSANMGAYMNTGTLENCSVQSGWNNAAGHAFRTDNTTVPLKNSVFKVANGSANCLYATSPLVVKYAQNTFEGATTPVNANITQGIVNTQDNQGNILI